MNFYGLKIHGCKIIDGENGSFISFPSWRDKDGKWHRYAGFDSETMSQDVVDDITGSVIGVLEG